MSGTIPTSPKIYHIVHIDKLASIITGLNLLCDTEIEKLSPTGTTIGMGKLKRRRMTDLKLKTSPSLFVGDCVPFYFCPRSVMLYMFHCKNHPDIDYKGGQEPVVHLEADLNTVVAWADANNHNWAFTSSNAASRYFQDYNDLSDLGEINWDVVGAKYWSKSRDEKQAEFLIENSFPWHLVERIGVENLSILKQVQNSLLGLSDKPTAQLIKDWYY